MGEIPFNEHQYMCKCVIQLHYEVNNRWSGVLRWWRVCSDSKLSICAVCTGVHTVRTVCTGVHTSFISVTVVGFL